MQNTQTASNISIAVVNNFTPKVQKEKAAELLSRLGYTFTREEGFWTLQKGDPRVWGQVLRKTLGKEGYTLVR